MSLNDEEYPRTSAGWDVARAASRMNALNRVLKVGDQVLNLP